MGVSLGSVPAWWLSRYGVLIGGQTVGNMGLPVSEVMRAELSVSVVAGAFILGLITAAVGALVPALRAASIQPVTAMRSGR